MLYDFSRYARSREKPEDKKIMNRTAEAKSLPDSLAEEYGLTLLSGQKKETCWELVCQEGSFLVREIKATNSEATEFLKWWERLNKEGCEGVPLLVKTKEGKSSLEYDGGLFFATTLPKGEAFKGENREHLRACAREMGNIHTHSGRWSLPAADVAGRPWVRRIQDRLTELLTINKFLQKRRALNDFENLFLESFDFLYNQGQEAVQHMALYTTESGTSSAQSLLINCFTKKELMLNGKQAIFLDLRKSRPGEKAQDLVQLLTYYLPAHDWDPGVLREILQAYLEKGSLEEPERHLLQALLRFPTRFWLLTYWYLGSEKNTAVLEEQLKRYIRECKLRDKCLDSLESIFWGE